jgi:hypothetical protein
MLANMFCVVGFEVPILRLMKVNIDGHDLTNAQLSSAESLFAPIFQLSGFPNWQKDLAKIIYTDK